MNEVKFFPAESQKAHKSNLEILRKEYYNALMRNHTTKIAITFPTRLIERLKNKASLEYGFDVPEIMRKLAADYLDGPSIPIPTEYLTAKQEAKYLEDINEIRSDIKKGHTPVAHSLQELKKQIKEDK